MIIMFLKSEADIESDSWEGFVNAVKKHVTTISTEIKKFTAQTALESAISNQKAMTDRNAAIKKEMVEIADQLQEKMSAEIMIKTEASTTAMKQEVQTVQNAMKEDVKTVLTQIEILKMKILSEEVMKRDRSLD